MIAVNPIQSVPVAARTIALMSARTVLGRLGHTSTTAANSESIGPNSEPSAARSVLRKRRPHGFAILLRLFESLPDYYSHFWPTRKLLANRIL